MSDNTIASAFRALEKPYRRQLLVGITERNPQDGDMYDLFDIVATDEVPDTMEVEILHQHLPLLEQAGYIEWDRDTDTIGAGPEWDEIRPMVELLHEHNDELPEGWS